MPRLRRHDPDEQWKPGYEEPAEPARSHSSRLRVPVPSLRWGRTGPAAVDPAAVLGHAQTGVRELPPDGGPIVSAEDVVRTYPGPQRVMALRGVSLRAMPGDFVALLGPSGSGKSTLLGLMAGLDEPAEGRVCWHGRSFGGLGHREMIEIRRRGIGMVFQNFGLLPTLSALENAELPLRVAGCELGQARRIAAGWLERLDLADRAEHRVFELSAGQQQRVAIARALVIEPEVVLADEPIAEVDTENAELILVALGEVSQRGGAVICATHNPAALAHASRAVLLRDGRIEATGTPQEVAGLLTTD